MLVQQSKMAAMGEMIDNIAHQWKQPLGVISMLNGLVKLSNEHSGVNKKDEIISESVENIEHEVKHLTSTINDFRNFFSPNKERKEFFIEDSIERLFRLLNPRLKNENIEIIKNIDSLKIESIENELVQVLMNVVNNAIDAVAESKVDKKYIFVDAYEEKNNLVISIKDNGGGIPLEIGNKIFESRFTTKEEGKGTGIGLYMSRQVMSSLNGTLTVENSDYEFEEKSYRGANFIISIPKS
ncbi:MAG: Putative two-component sensor histidine kinase [uncultured Sulfurovum sp.]|uniref:histidine kinase n=1 Tax=uncultured Sulfurovum sp. TaxID=269237 RepID=A0A6S6S0X8_9BACT|nr:MAG: Putative two-component sensor histidine kinase [uncultured Sulfurovum sp.]